MPEIRVVSEDVVRAFARVKSAKQSIMAIYELIRLASDERSRSEDAAWALVRQTYPHLPDHRTHTLRYSGSRQVISWEDSDDAPPPHP